MFSRSARFGAYMCLFVRVVETVSRPIANFLLINLSKIMHSDPNSVPRRLYNLDLVYNEMQKWLYALFICKCKVIRTIGI